MRLDAARLTSTIAFFSSLCDMQPLNLADHLEIETERQKRRSHFNRSCGSV